MELAMLITKVARAAPKVAERAAAGPRPVAVI